MKIAKTYKTKMSAMMFEFEFAEIEEEFGAESGIELKFKAIDMIRTSFLKSNPVYKFEGDLWIFKDSNDAVQAAVQMKACLAKYNKN